MFSVSAIVDPLRRLPRPAGSRRGRSGRAPGQNLMFVPECYERLSPAVNEIPARAASRASALASRIAAPAALTAGAANA